MIELSFDGSDVRLSEFIRKRGGNILLALQKRFTILGLMIQRHLIQNHLSAPGGFDSLMLHHRTGKLIQSIRALPAEASSGGVSLTVQGGGGPAFYGKYHEFGGTFLIPEHVRRIGFNAKGKRTRLLTIGGTGRVRRGVDKVEAGTVKAHNVTYPMRSFMRSSLGEMRGAIIQAVALGVREGLAG